MNRMLDSLFPPGSLIPVIFGIGTGGVLGAGSSIYAATLSIHVAKGIKNKMATAILGMLSGVILLGLPVLLFFLPWIISPSYSFLGSSRPFGLMFAGLASVNGAVLGLLIGLMGGGSKIGLVMGTILGSVLAIKSYGWAVFDLLFADLAPEEAYWFFLLILIEALMGMSIGFVTRKLSRRLATGAPEV